MDNTIVVLEGSVIGNWSILDARARRSVGASPVHALCLGQALATAAQVRDANERTAHGGVIYDLDRHRLVEEAR